MEDITFEQGKEIIDLLKSIRVIFWIVEAATVSGATTLVFSSWRG